MMMTTTTTTKPQQPRVICVVRSRATLLRVLNDDDNDDKEDDVGQKWPLLTIIEGTVLEMSDELLRTLVVDHDVDVIVSCLGHNGIFSRPRRLVTDTLARLVDVCSSSSKKKQIKLILMSSDGVFAPNVDDPRTSIIERIIFWLLRYLLPPHADNEDAAAYLQHHLPSSSLSQSQQPQQSNHNNVQWVIVRPTDLVNESTITEYVLFDQPPPGGVLFGQPHAVSRINVANFMVRLITDENLFTQYKFTLPVIHNNKQAVAPSPDDRHNNTNDQMKKTA
jgi:hypothetical protein